MFSSKSPQGHDQVPHVVDRIDSSPQQPQQIEESPGIYPTGAPLRARSLPCSSAAGRGSAMAVAKHAKVTLVLVLDEPMYIAGNALTGRLEISIAAAQKLRLGEICVELEAVEVLTSRDHAASQNFAHNRIFFQGRNLPPSNAVLPSAPLNGYWAARRGRTTYPFQFALPSDGPSSVEFSGHAAVRYSCKASMQIWHEHTRSSLSCTADANVTEKWEDVGNPIYRQPVEGVSEAKLFMGGQSGIWLEASVNRKLQFGGHKAMVRLGVRNGSKRETSGVRLDILRCLSFPSKSGEGLPGPLLSEILHTQHFHGSEYNFKAESEMVLNLPLDIPVDVRSIRKTQLFEVHIAIVAALSLGTFAKELEVKLPLFVAHPSGLLEPSSWQFGMDGNLNDHLGVHDLHALPAVLQPCNTSTPPINPVSPITSYPQAVLEGSSSIERKMAGDVVTLPLTIPPFVVSQDTSGQQIVLWETAEAGGWTPSQFGVRIDKQVNDQSTLIRNLQPSAIEQDPWHHRISSASTLVLSSGDEEQVKAPQGLSTVSEMLSSLPSVSLTNSNNTNDDVIKRDSKVCTSTNWSHLSPSTLKDHSKGNPATMKNIETLGGHAKISKAEIERLEHWAVERDDEEEQVQDNSEQSPQVVMKHNIATGNKADDKEWHSNHTKSHLHALHRRSLVALPLQMGLQDNIEPSKADISPKSEYRDLHNQPPSLTTTVVTLKSTIAQVTTSNARKMQSSSPREKQESMAVATPMTRKGLPDCTQSLKRPESSVQGRGIEALERRLSSVAALNFHPRTKTMFGSKGAEEHDIFPPDVGAHAVSPEDILTSGVPLLKEKFTESHQDHVEKRSVSKNFKRSVGKGMHMEQDSLKTLTPIPGEQDSIGGKTILAEDIPSPSTEKLKGANFETSNDIFSTIPEPYETTLKSRTLSVERTASNVLSESKKAKGAKVAGVTALRTVSDPDVSQGGSKLRTKLEKDAGTCTEMPRSSPRSGMDSSLCRAQTSSRAPPFLNTVSQPKAHLTVKARSPIREESLPAWNVSRERKAKTGLTAAGRLQGEETNIKSVTGRGTTKVLGRQRMEELRALWDRS